MISIRKNVFETNSSSTHSIAISKEPLKFIPNYISFGFGEYGWETDTVDDTASYLYTAIYELNKYDDYKMYDCLDKIKTILDKHHIQYKFAEPKEDEWGYYGYVDHYDELISFIEDIVNDEDKLLRYLFGNSVIYTGNDNSGKYTDMCYCAEDSIWEDENGNYCKSPNPNYHPDKYDYYFKGN